MTKRGGQNNPILDSFRLVARTRQQIEEVSRHAKGVVKRFYKDPADLAAFIERKGTPVYMLGGGKMGGLVLKALGFEPGFIPPSDSRRYQALVKLLCRYEDKPEVTFEYGVFVLTQPLFTVGFMTHQLHHWLACRSGMSGYGERAQQLYQEFWGRHEGRVSEEVLKLPPEELVRLKEAINRDLEALLFLRNIVDEVFNPANQGKKLATGKTRA